MDNSWQPDDWRKRTEKGIDFYDTSFLTYLWICPHRKYSGLFRLPMGYVRVDTGLTQEQIDAHLEALAKAGEIVYEPETQIILLKGYMAAQPVLTTPNVSPLTAKGILNNVRELQADLKNGMLTSWKAELDNIPKLKEEIAKHTNKND